VIDNLIEQEAPATATITLTVEGDWDDFRIRAWLKRNGWWDEGVRLDWAKAQEPGESVLMKLTGPRDAILAIQAQEGGRVVS